MLWNWNMCERFHTAFSLMIIKLPTHTTVPGHILYI